MTPRKLAEWMSALFIAAVVLLAIFAIARDVLGSRTPFLDQLVGIDNPARAAMFVVGVAAAIALALVLLFRSTTGSLEFEAIGIKFRGPSGPILLWTVAFLAVCGAGAALLPLLRTPPADKPTVHASPAPARLETLPGPALASSASFVSPPPAVTAAKVPPAPLTHVAFERALQENRGNIERVMASLPCISLDFAIQGSSTDLEIYCGIEGDRLAMLHGDLERGMETRKLSVIAPEANAKLLAIAVDAVGTKSSRKKVPFVHRYITDKGTRYLPWQLPRTLPGNLDPTPSSSLQKSPDVAP